MHRTQGIDHSPEGLAVQAVAIFVGVVTAGILLVGYLFNALL